MTILSTMVKGARSSFRAGVTLDGREVGERMFPLDNGRGTGIALVGDQWATYEEIYRTQLWVQVVVNRLARSIARLPLKVYVNPDEPGERERMRAGPLPELLAMPVKPPMAMGKNALVQAIVSNVAIHGNCVLVKRRPRPGMPPTELLPSSFGYWRIERDTPGNVWYRFAGGPGFVFRPEEVVHFKWWATGSGLVASSPLEALRQTLATEDATQRATIAAFENGIRQNGAFVTDGKLTEDARTRIREEMQAKYGGVDNAFRAFLLEGGLKWMSMQQTHEESGLIDLRKIAREEVAAAYNIPPPVVGILDRATFSNITEQHLMEYQDTVQPWTEMIAEMLAVQLIAAEPLMQGQYAEFDFGGILAGSPMQQIQTLTSATGGRAIMTQNEARARLNLPPKGSEWADELGPGPNAPGEAWDNGKDSAG